MDLKDLSFHLRKPKARAVTKWLLLGPLVFLKTPCAKHVGTALPPRHPAQGISLS